jgi:phosphoglycolate phosphatase-like HAD superfamily hydrolase
VLDFDGVLADSQAEVASAGYAAAAQRWPQLFDGVDEAGRARVMAGLAPTRARLVRGYETMVMARLILESGDAAVARILRPGWDARGGLLEWSLASWGEDEAQLAALFERLRGQLVERDPEAWVATVPLYPGIKEALADCPYPFYIASSKREDRLVRLLNGLLGLGVEEGSPRVIASLIPPNQRKIEALR